MKVSRLLMVVAIGASCVGAYWLGLGLGSREAPETKPRHQVIGGLVVDTAVLDLGEVWEANDFPFDLPIHNQTNEEVKIDDFSASCSCVAVEPPSLRIGAGQTANVHLTVDLTQRAPWERRVGQRQLRLEVTPIFKGNERRKHSWLIQGQILSRVTLDTDFLEFGEEPVHNGPPATRKVAALTHVRALGLEVSVNPLLATVEVVPVSGHADQFQLQVTPHTNLKPGPFKFELTVNVLTPEGEVLSGCTLPVAGTMSPEVRPLPARLLLGAKPVGQIAEASVILQVPEGMPWSVDHIETSSSDISVNPVKPRFQNPRGAGFQPAKHRQAGSLPHVLKRLLSRQEVPRVRCIASAFA